MEQQLYNIEPKEFKVVDREEHGNNVRYELEPIQRPTQCPQCKDSNILLPLLWGFDGRKGVINIMWKPFESQYKIYPCPFCGYRGLLYRVGSGYVIRCENLACHAEQNVYLTEKAAVHKWNRRIYFDPNEEEQPNE